MALPSRGASLIALCVIFWAIAIVFVALRLWGRAIKKQAWVWNDFAAVIALVFASSVAICNIIAVVDGGIGYHTRFVPIQRQLVSLKIYTVVWLLQAFANTFVRLSFLDLLLRIFSIQAWFKSTIKALTVLTVLYMIGCFITFFALCTPLEANWNPTVPHAHCGNRYLPFLLSAIFNFLLDLAIIISPMPLLWNLKTTINRKWTLTVVFGTGVVVCVMTVLRTVAVVDFNPPEAKLDYTYTVYFDALWSSLEPSLGVVNICLPLLAPIAQKVNESSFFSSLLGSGKTSKAAYRMKQQTSGGSDRRFEHLPDEEDGDYRRNTSSMPL